MATDQCTIYAMSDPAEKTKIRYIGKTKIRLRQRLSQHITQTHRRKTHKNDWVDKVVRGGSKPLIWPLEVCTNDNWQGREKYWIQLFKPSGWLVNRTDGGTGGPNMTGYRHTDEAREKIRQAGIGRKRSAFSIETIRRIWTGRKHTPETRLKMSQALERAKKNGNRFWLKGISACHKHNTGKTRPPELVEKIRLAMINSPRHANKCKRVKCVETGQIFPSHVAAENHFGMLRHLIGRAMRRGGKAGRKHWVHV